MEPRYLDSGEVAALLKVTTLTLYRWRRINTGPPCVLIGRHYLYEQSALLRWIDQQPKGRPPAVATGTQSAKVRSNPTLAAKAPPKPTKGSGSRQGEADRRFDLAEQAKALRGQGLSWQAIAAKWNAEGVPTLRGGRWDASTVRNMTLRAEQAKQQNQQNAIDNTG